MSLLSGLVYPTISKFRFFCRTFVSSNANYPVNNIKTGLFGINELQTPNGFRTLYQRTIAEANTLVNSIYGAKQVVPIFDQLSNSLCKVADMAEFVRISHPQGKFRAAAEEASVAISALVERLNTDSRLYEALKNSEIEGDLDRYVAELFLFDFEQSGIHLNEQDRNQVLQLNESILKFGSLFAANANHESTGLRSANEMERERAFKDYLRYDEYQDKLLTNILECRLKLAQLCGFTSYAHRAIKGGIAETPEVVNELLDILKLRVRKLAAKDYEQMLFLKSKEGGGCLKAWDLPYYSDNYRKFIYNENLRQCLPYFSVDACMKGLNMIVNQLYRVNLKVDTVINGELWHEDVIKLTVIDEDSNTILGYIYCDLFARPNKQQQECHHTIRGGCRLPDGSYQLPIVVIVLGLSANSESNPSLLSPSMVDNLFHEMGHAMHSMLARTKYQHVTGTRCSTDFAEVPSILMEFFASDPRVVSKFAHHYATGQPIPSDLMKCWLESKKVFVASETELQIFYSALDQAYHSSEVGKESTTDVLARIQSNFYSLPYVENTAWQLKFTHLVGYGAKYYSYLVSRAVATAIWTKLFAQEPLSPIAGERYKREVLSHGGGKPAAKIAEDLLGCRVDAEFIAGGVISSFRQPIIS